MRQADDKSPDDEQLDPDEIEAVPDEALCDKCGIGWMKKSNMSAGQKKLGEFRWHYQATCDNPDCGFTERQSAIYRGRRKPKPPTPELHPDPQPDLFTQCNKASNV